MPCVPWKTLALPLLLFVCSRWWARFPSGPSQIFHVPIYLLFFWSLLSGSVMDSVLFSPDCTSYISGGHTLLHSLIFTTQAYWWWCQLVFPVQLYIHSVVHWSVSHHGDSLWPTENVVGIFLLSGLHQSLNDGDVSWLSMLSLTRIVSGSEMLMCFLYIAGEIYTSDSLGSDETGDGSAEKPFKSVLQVNMCYGLWNCLKLFFREFKKWTLNK